MKNTLYFLIILSSVHPIINAGSQEETARILIKLFRHIMTSEYLAEVTNAEQHLNKGKLRPSIKHLLIAATEIAIEVPKIDFGNAREHFAHKADTKQVLKEMVDQLASEKLKAQFPDQITADLLEQARSNIND